MQCEDMRVSSRQRKQQGCFWGFWLFPYVWEDGCDNCYLGGEQRKQLHQGEGRAPLGMAQGRGEDVRGTGAQIH